MNMFLSQSYFPAFRTTENEFMGYVKTSDAVKDGMLPVITLWGDIRSAPFEQAFEAVLTATDGRKVIVDFDPIPKEPKTEAERERAQQRKIEKMKERGKVPKPKTQKQIDAHKRSLEIWEGKRTAYNARVSSLMSPDGGYAEWRRFSDKGANIIPVAKLDDPVQARVQVKQLMAAGRDVAFRVDIRDPASLRNFLDAARGLSAGDRGILILDAGYIRNDMHAARDKVIQALGHVRRELPNMFDEITKVCMSGSFPTFLQGLLSPLRMFELDLYDGVRQDGWDVRYGDHASLPLKGKPTITTNWYPHVDLVAPDAWHVKRGTEGKNKNDYPDLARKLVAERDAWQARSLCWGTDMIQAAANDQLEQADVTLDAPGPWIGVRVNQHLTRHSSRPVSVRATRT